MSRKIKADEFFQEQDAYEIERLKAELQKEKQNVSDMRTALERSRRLWSSSYTPPKVAKRKKLNRKYVIRVSVGDLHGNDQDLSARSAFLSDLETLNPDQLVLGGDIINCGGTFSRFHRVHVTDFGYSYENDVAAGNDFIDECQKRAPRADISYLEGNHESRVDKWAAATFNGRYLAELAIDTFGAKRALHLDKRGIKYYKNNECHDGLNKPGILMLGECGYVHGYGGGKHVSYATLLDLGINVVHFHNHRSQSHVKRTAKAPAIGAWCPGCLCILQQYYNHEKPTDHTHGYNLQFEDPKNNWFSSSNIGIIDGKSLLHLVEIK